VLIGGFIIDRIGLRKSLMIFGVLCFIGPAITAATGKLPVMAAGRLIFGMGAESLNVAVTAALARWFRGKELSFAFGLNLTASRLGTFAALNSPTWARAAYASWRTPFLIALAFTSMCVVGSVIYWMLEVYAEKNYHLGEVSTDKVVFADLLEVRRELLADRSSMHCLLFGYLPFPDFRSEVFHGGAWYVPRIWWISVEHADVVCHDRNPTLFGLLVDRVGRRAILMMLGSMLLIPVYLMMAYMHSARHVILHIPFFGTWDLCCSWDHGA
jgi:MFS family permease